MRKSISTLIFVLFAIFCFGQNTDTDAIKSLVQGIAKSWTTFPKTLDKQSILKYYSIDYKGTSIVLNYGQDDFTIDGGDLDYNQNYSDIEELLSGMEDEMALGNYGILNKIWSIDDKDIVIYGNIAYIEFWSDFKVSVDGKIQINSQRLTNYVLIKVQNEWKILRSSEIDNVHSNDYCFPAESLVMLVDDNCRQIEEIQKGDVIKVYDFTQKKFTSDIVDDLIIHKNNNFDLITLTYENSNLFTASSSTQIPLFYNTLTATQNHPIFTDDGFKQVQEIREGDFIYVYSSDFNNLIQCKVVDVNTSTKTNLVYNIKLKNSDNYYVNGVMVKMK